MFNFLNFRIRSQHFKVFEFSICNHINDINDINKDNIINIFLNLLIKLNEHFQSYLQRTRLSTNVDNMFFEIVFRNSAIENQSIEHIEFIEENFDINSTNKSNIYTFFY